MWDTLKGKLSAWKGLWMDEINFKIFLDNYFVCLKKKEREKLKFGKVVIVVNLNNNGMINVRMNFECVDIKMLVKNNKNCWKDF